MSTPEPLDYLNLRDGAGQTQEFQEALEVLHQLLIPGLGAEGSTKAYDETAAKYDGVVAALYDSTAQEKAAQTLADMFPEQSRGEKVRILDVAAGTGRVGEEMHKLGFRTMDALDPSEGMLAEARKKDIYGQFFMEYIGDKKLPIDDDTYDAIVMCGAMVENHLPCSAFHEMVRIVKPGGYIVNVTRVEHLLNCSEYVGRFDQLVEQLEKEGRWRQVSRTSFPNYMKDTDGLLIVHQVL